MAKVKVYKVQCYDIMQDEQKVSQRMTTRKGAETMRGIVIESTEVEIDDSQLEPGEQWTPKGFTL